MDSPAFHEAGFGEVPIRQLGLRITGTPLEPVLEEFGRELDAVGIKTLRPRYYLSTEWGVPFETIALAIPFYLAHPRLAELHGERTGMIEGHDPAEVLRYLRHEMGHVLNYAYKLYERPDWIAGFGAITQPYVDEYTPQPWSRRHVHHLPGWYAQKHPDEDWAETFAVWMTPGRDWRAEYAAWPDALAKLALCERIIAEIADAAPVVTDDELDEDVEELEQSPEQFYRETLPAAPELPPGVDGALRSIFRELPAIGDLVPAAPLIRRHALALARSVYTWTGHFPEPTRALLAELAARADADGLTYPANQEPAALIALTALITSLAMNFVQRGAYLP